MNPLLANCPFCGRQQLQINHNHREFMVTCRCCSASGPHHEEFNHAIASWNLLSGAIREDKNTAPLSTPTECEAVH